MVSMCSLGGNGAIQVRPRTGDNSNPPDQVVLMGNYIGNLPGKDNAFQQQAGITKCMIATNATHLLHEPFYCSMLFLACMPVMLIYFDWR